MANITYRDAVGKALQDSMREESRLIIIGQNLTGHALKSLAETYGAERVRDCSISESAMVGIAVGAAMKMVLLPGETVQLRLVREGKDKGQAVGYMSDGTMVVVNNGAPMIGQQVEVQIQSTLQTGAGIIVFADVKRAGDVRP